jgi:CheY-like chemotaxis protein
MSPSPTGDKTVLCVDDTAYVLQMLEMFLTTVGYRVVAAASGQEAIALASKHELNAAILDYEMPELNGLEVAQILRQTHPRLPILMYSARQPQTEITAAGLVDAYVEKEHPQELVMALARVLGDPPPALVRRRFPRYSVKSPFMLRVSRLESDDDVILRGSLKDLAEGGFGGVIDGKMVPGEVAAFTCGIPKCELRLELRARVCYRDAESHGFEFIDLTASQQKDLQRCLQVLATG